MVDQYQEYEDRFLGDYGAVMHKAMLQAKTETDFAANRREFLLLSSREASALYADCIFDFIFIDADHSYEAVQKDIVWWLPKVRIGGLMMGHDYGGRQHGVKRAVDEQFTDVQVGRGKVWWVEK
jgi:predicted O-methyltransferase YrrM